MDTTTTTIFGVETGKLITKVNLVNIDVCARIAQAHGLGNIVVVEYKLPGGEVAKAFRIENGVVEVTKRFTGVAG